AQWAYEVTLDAGDGIATYGEGFSSPIYAWKNHGYVKSVPEWSASTTTNPTIINTNTVIVTAEKEGYISQGYQSGGTTYIKADGKLSSSAAPMFTSAQTWTCGWSAISYTIHFDGNGNTGGNIPSDINATYDVEYSVPTATPTKASYTFRGWAKDRAATSPDYIVGGDKLINLTTENGATVTLYAVWEENTATIRFAIANDSAGWGTLSKTSETIGVVNGATSCIATSNAGYALEGWYDGATKITTTDEANNAYIDSENSNTLHVHSTPTSLLQDKTYTAKFIGETITLSWDSCGGSQVGDTTQVYSSSSKVILPTTVPTLEGYSFEGWWTRESGGTQVFNTTALPTSDTTYYAHWQIGNYSVSYQDADTEEASSANFAYGTTITMNPDGGTFSPATPEGWTASGSGFTRNMPAEAIELPVPTRDKFSFKGWRLNNTTFTAVWDKAVYRILLNGGEGVNAISASQYNYTYGNQETITLTVTARSGYDVNRAVCVCSDAGVTITANGGGTFSAKIGQDVWGDITFTATCPKAYSYTLEYYDNAGGDTPIATQTETGNKVTLPDETDERFRKEGYLLLGWADAPNATAVTYQAGAEVDALTTEDGAVVKLYAVYALRLSCSIPVEMPLKFNVETGKSIPASIEVKSDTVVPINFSAYALATETGLWLFPNADNRDNVTFNFKDANVVFKLPLLYTEPGSPTYRMLVERLEANGAKSLLMSLETNGADWRPSDEWNQSPSNGQAGLNGLDEGSAIYQLNDSIAQICWYVSASE
ncbi:InlB B-repeat-containing protein, partial [Adlercreutzia sp. ZJ304]|uniref:InlB B-repeat-containing protein n=1 Tax=Adlercreutzia sp. ZJ304 TaxID=2709791 RepID=UPI0013EC94DC